MRIGESIVYLMYHEIELPGRAICNNEPGYQRYVVRRADFEAQMRLLKSEGWCCQSVSEALVKPGRPGVAITFDDGTETDLIVAAPVLKEAGFQATFYITLGFLGRRGYLSIPQLRELCGLGFEIGCHSKTHPYLSDLDVQGLQREIAEAKRELEQIVGAEVRHFACPGGRYDARAREVARNAGYASVATSRPYANPASGDHLALGRIVVMRDTSLATFQRLCRGQGLWKKQLRVAAHQRAQNLLGNKRYDRLRALVLSSLPHLRQLSE